MMRMTRSRTSLICAGIVVCVCFLVIGRTVLHVTYRASVAVDTGGVHPGFKNPDSHDVTRQVKFGNSDTTHQAHLVARQGHQNVSKSFRTVYESLASHRDELTRLRRTKAFQLPMRTEMSDIKKEGWESDNLLEQCRVRDYGDLTSWPKASVILAFHDNEHLSDVLHTVHSILQRSPEVLLKEIIIIDDNSIKDDFRDTFHYYCSAIFGDIVKIIRSDKNLGLIKARLLGSRAASGDVIISMDAHMEVQDTWLEALLWEIRVNRMTLATAALDWMLYDPQGGWTYRTGFSSFMCTFGWSLGFGFGYSQPAYEQAWKRDNTMAIPSPCTVGTIWAIEKKFFIEIGELDEGMEKWGGENLDLAIRTWLFGGRAVQVPCSHAAHLERPHQRDYRSGWDQYTNKNYKRVISVWFDEYDKLVYLENPVLENVDPGDISERLEVKTRALHNFTWYLDNVFPELGAYNRNFIGNGWLKNIGQNKCIHRIGNDPLTLWQCSGDYKKEGIFLTLDGYIRTDLQVWHAKDKKIGSIIGPEGATGTYHDGWLSQWIHWKDGPMMLYEADSGGAVRSLCMEGFPNHTVSLQSCNADNTNQFWQWRIYSKQYDDVMNNQMNTAFHNELRRIHIAWNKMPKLQGEIISYVVKKT